MNNNDNVMSIINNLYLKNFSNEQLTYIFKTFEEKPFLIQIKIKEDSSKNKCYFDIDNSSKSIFFNNDEAKLVFQSEYKEYHNIFLNKIISIPSKNELEITLRINVNQFIFIGLIEKNKMCKQDISFVKGLGGAGIINLDKLISNNKEIFKLGIINEIKIKDLEIIIKIKKNQIQ